MLFFHRLPFLLTLFGFPAEGLPNVPVSILGGGKGAHLASCCLQSCIFLFGGPSSFTIHGNLLLPQPQLLKSSHSPLSVGPPILIISRRAHERGEAEGSERSTPGSHAEGYFCISFLPVLSCILTALRPRLSPARPGSASPCFLPEVETKRGTHLCPSPVTRLRHRGLLPEQDLQARRTPMGDPNGRGLRHFKRLFSGKHPSPPCAL